MLKDRWATEAASDLRSIEDPVKRSHLTQARKELDRIPYQWFCKEYDLHREYNIIREVNDGINGARVIHTSNSNAGYFIPDDDDVNGIGICRCTKQFGRLNGCCHGIAKRISEGKVAVCVL